MTIATIAPAGLDDEQPKTSYDQGLQDGELAAVTKLPARRALAIASMADQYDPLYAQGYGDGYLHGIQINAAHAQREARR